MAPRRRRRRGATPARPHAAPEAETPSGNGPRLRRAAVSLASTVTVAVTGAVAARVVNSYHPVPGAPVKASVDVDADTGAGTRIVTPGLIRREQIPESYDGAQRWALSRGGAETVSYLDVTLEGRRSPSVVIRQIRATVTGREPALRGSLLTFPGSEGSAETVDIAFDLRETTPIARRADPGARHRQPYFAGHYLTLGFGEQIVLKVEVLPGGCLCTWRLDLDTVAGGVSQTIAVPGAGRSLRSTSEQPPYQAAYYFHPADHSWVSRGAGDRP